MYECVAGWPETVHYLYNVTLILECVYNYKQIQRFLQIKQWLMLCYILKNLMISDSCTYMLQMLYIITLCRNGFLVIS